MLPWSLMLECAISLTTKRRMTRQRPVTGYIEQGTTGTCMLGKHFLLYRRHCREGLRASGNVVSWCCRAATFRRSVNLGICLINGHGVCVDYSSRSVSRCRKSWSARRAIRTWSLLSVRARGRNKYAKGCASRGLLEQGTPGLRSSEGTRFRHCPSQPRGTFWACFRHLRALSGIVLRK